MTRSNTITGENSTLFTKAQISVLLLLRAKGGPGVFLLSGRSRSSIREYCSRAHRLREKPTSIIMIILIDILIGTVT